MTATRATYASISVPSKLTGLTKLDLNRIFYCFLSIWSERNSIPRKS